MRKLHLFRLPFFCFFLLIITIPVQGQNWILVWSDEFSEPGLPDSTKWAYDIGGGGWGNNELEYYTEKRIENAEVKDSMLVITARKESFQVYHTMQISTPGTSEFHENFFIILNVAVGGNWPGSPDASTVFPQTMKADYVRVYVDSAMLADVPEWQRLSNNSNHFKVYPNPARPFFVIEDLDNYSMNDPEQIEIYTLLGQPILVKMIPVNTNTWKVNVNHIPGGLYILRICTPTGSVQKRIIIN
ncbi:MAG: T9SS type A sorting domain-containing protein [Chlorobi bacterium]|nr:T9SS type A sorting domain-containing protein [Chlorobiota bacterium]